MSARYQFRSRQLSPSETICDVMHSQGANVLMHVALLQTNAHLTEDILHKALHTLWMCQPALGMKIVTETNKKGKITKRFTEMEESTIDLEVLPNFEPKKWLAVAEEELALPLPAAEGPLWNVRYVEFDNTESEEDIAEKSHRLKIMRHKPGITTQYKYSGALLFKIHHAIADGVSVFDLIYRQLIPIISTILKNGDLSSCVMTVPMMHSADESFQNTETKDQPWYKKMFSSSDTRSKSRGSFSEPLVYVPSDHTGRKCENKTKIMSFALPDGLTRRFIRSCKRHEVTVHATLVSISSVILHELMQTEKMRTSDDVTVGFSIDLRKYRTLATPQPLGLWVGNGKVKVKVPRTMNLDKFWEIVTAVSAQVLEEQRYGKPWKLLTSCKNVLKQYTKKHSNWSVVEDFPSKYHLEIGNLGRLDTYVPDSRSSRRLRGSLRSDIEADPEPLCMTEHYYFRSFGDTTSTSILHTVCTLHGKLMWTICYNARWVTSSFAQDYITRIQSLLRHVSHPASRVSSELSMVPPYMRAQMMAVPE